MQRNHRSFKSIIAITLVLSIIITCGPNTVIAKAEDNNSVITRLTTAEKQGVILHAWDWSFNNVTANLDAIKAAGYTEIQVSPIQVNKDLNDEYTTSDKWWILYQPAGFQIGNKQLGTEDEFKAMCAAAKAKGIKIIVDTIVNHMGNNGDPDIPAEEVADLDPDLSLANHPDMWHVDSNGKLNVISDYNNRYDVTHNGVGLPDLNTANPLLQEKIKLYLQKCLDDGAAGFRFDTAKHVELPIDPDNVKSDFWPNVLSGLHTADGNTPFIYGEVLQGGADNIAGYAKYFNVTASKYGADIRSTVGVGTSGPNLSGNIDKLKSYDVPSGIDNTEIVTWVESHDTYANDSSESTPMTDEQIKNGWAIVASRENSTPLFFDRPAGRKKLQGNIGDAGSDTWKDPDVVAINKFHTAMDGQDESLIKLSDNVLMIERGTSSGASKKGVVIVNLDSIPYQLPAGQAINLEDGIYTNCAPVGGTFTVASGQISGTVPSGITVLYADGIPEQPVITPKVSIDKEDCSFADKLDLTLHVTSAASATYSIDGAPQGSYADGQTITIGESAAAGATIKVVVSATSSDGKTASETYTYIKRDPNAKTVVYFTKPAGWQLPYAYVYNDLKENYNNEAWPGTKMVKIGDNLYKLEISGFTNGQVIFNDWFYGSHQTSAFTIAPSESVEKKLYDTDGTWKDTTATFDNGTTLPDDGVTNGTAKVYFQKPSTAEWAYNDVNIYFYGKGGPSWPGVPMTKVSDNLYTYTLPAGLEGSNVIFNANAGKIQVPGSGESGLTAPANTSMILADGVWKEYTKGVSKAYFRKPSDWAEPNIYVFNDQGVKVSEWPGVKMDKVAGTETLYSYTLPENFGDAKIIFNDKIAGNDSGNQTADLVLPFETSKIYDETTKTLRDFTLDDLQEPEKPSTDAQGVTKVYFKNTFGWEKVNVYAYNDGSSDKVKDWPGASAVDEGNGLYSYTLPKGFESATVIFNNGGKGKQTNNLPTKVGSTMEFVSDGTETDGKLNGELVSKSKVYFKNTSGWSSVKIYYWVDANNNGWPGSSMVDEGDNLYSFVMPDGFENANVIFNNNGKGKQSPDKQAQAGKTLILDGDTWREFTEADIPGANTKPTNPGDNEEVGSTVYVKVPSGWNGIPNIHYWNTAGGTTTWPGVAMKDEGNGIYSAAIPKSFGDVSIIINDGSNKLADKDGNTEFTVKLGSTIIFEDGAWKDYVKPTPDPGAQEVSKTPIVDGIIYTGTTTVKGTAGANADVVLGIDEDNVTTSAAVQCTTSAGAQYVIGTSKSDENGNWLVQIPAQSKGTVIKITAKEEGKLEASITVTVQEKPSSSSGSSSGSDSGSSYSHSSHRKEKTVTVDGNSTIIKSSDASVIIDGIVNANTSNIVVKLSSSQSVAMKSIFEALLSKPDKTLTLVQGNVSLTFKGTDLLANGAADLDTTIQSISSNASAINNLTNGAEIIDLSFAYKGAFPGKATITTDVNSKYNNKLMYVYSYNAANNRLTLVSLNVPVQNGEVSFTASKGSDYVLSEKPITGAVTEGWNKITDGNWIYVKDENNVAGWIYDGGNWYLTNESGIMQKGWSKDRNGKWYYLNSAGAMQTGWLNDNGTWYYLSTSGDMLSDTTIDGYTLGVDGAWIA
ncbi:MULTISPECIES: starch-binding protein [unclassified Clostridium]|uniref:starch-binding protein n=1 Tax=unclassified Clostridium TaxID=2614128 RepID=UPI00029841E2|nr:MULTISPECIES: starch-binding protein [unclassified Clostridium]EKQ57478.1 MAG: putative cell wall binding protein [Clostridium sp. Maddingley MBC34-26]